MFETAVTHRLEVKLSPESVAELKDFSASHKKHAEEIQEYWRKALGMVAQTSKKTDVTKKSDVSESKVVKKKKKVNGTKKAKAPPVDKDSSGGSQPWLGSISLSASKEVVPSGLFSAASNSKALKFDSADFADSLVVSPLSPLQPLSSGSSGKSRKGTPAKPTDNIKRTKGVERSKAALKSASPGVPSKSSYFEDDSDFESPVKRGRGRPKGPSTPKTPKAPKDVSVDASIVKEEAVIGSSFSSPSKHFQTGHRSSSRINMSPLDSSSAEAPKRETREWRQWNEATLMKVPLGSVVYKDFGKLGVFKGKVMSFKYPFISIKYEDDDLEDFDAGNLLP